MNKDRKKRKRIYWTLTLIPIASAILFAILFPILYKKDFRCQITYPVGGDIPADEDQIMTVWFFDAGQADASLIRTPDGKYIMIDAGSNENENVLKSYLKEIGVKKLDGLFLSHEHEDHIGGADMLIRDFNVSAIVLNRYPEDSVNVEKMFRMMNQKSLKLSLPDNGEIFRFGDVSITVMLPDDDTDENSCAVFRVEYGNTVILYTGDAEADEEASLLSFFPRYLNCDILKVGHHGSSTSSTDAFLRAVKPEYAVISCGAANDYGHPNQEVLDRLDSIGCHVFRTDLDGTIVFRTDGTNLY